MTDGRRTIAGTGRAHRAAFDPGLRHLRAAVASMIAILLTFWTMLVVATAAPVDVDAIVLSVVVAVMLTRREARAELRERAVDLAVLALATVTAAGLAAVADGAVAGGAVAGGAGSGTPPPALEFVGEAAFVVALAAFVWVRRFGARASRLGTIATLPFIATLVTPLPVAVGSGFALWALVGVLVAFGWTAAVRWVASPPRAPGSEPSRAPGSEPSRAVVPVPPPAAAPVPAPLSAPSPGRRTRPLPSTRMALQLALSLVGAFAVGHALFPAHLVWPVITAYIVCSGNRGRGDVLYKGVLRVTGALAGTIAASVLMVVGLPGGTGAIVALFVVLAVALWLRPLNYAWWAAGVTAVLALLYGYFGQSGPGVLESRLLGVLWGGAIAIVISWFVLPVKTTDVLRRRAADALRALSTLVAATSATAPTTPSTEAPTPAVPTDTPSPTPTDTADAVPTDAPSPVPTDTPSPVPTDASNPVPTDASNRVPIDAAPLSVGAARLAADAAIERVLQLAPALRAGRRAAQSLPARLRRPAWSAGADLIDLLHGAASEVDAVSTAADRGDAPGTGAEVSAEALVALRRRLRTARDALRDLDPRRPRSETPSGPE